MNRLLLDTTLLIDVERASDDLDLIVDDDDDIAIAAITIAELRVGALLATGLRRARRNAYVDDVSATVPVIGYSLDVAEVHAGLLAEVRERGRPQAPTT